MELNNLTPAAGSVKTAKRIGRGPGSGLGGTSTRGHKGAKSRSGYSKKIGLIELHEAGFINKTQLVKILGNGTLTAKLTVEANAFSKSAEAAITAAGGTINKI